MIHDKFNDLLKTLSISDNSSIFPQEEKRKSRVIYKCNSGSMSIETFLIVYKNKKSYLYLEYLDTLDVTNDINKIKNNIKKLADKIIFKEKTRIVEVGWEVIYSKQPTEFELLERKKILYSFLQETYKNINNGMFGLKPEVGDILAAKPYGPKINQGFTEESLTIGKRQRSLFAKKFGFGELYEDGFQYGRYDENLILRPI